MSSQHILVTGAAGAVGRVVVRRLLEHGHRVRGFDRVPMADLSDQVVGNLTDLTAVTNAVRGMDAIIHLAATPDEADFVSDLVPNNIVGPYYIYSAAHEAGVKRVVVASTIRVGKMHNWQQKTVRVSDGYAPHDDYSFTKVASEVMGEMFARRYNMTVIMARIGWVVRNPNEAEQMASNKWGGEIALSQNDAANFFTACVENELHFASALRFVSTYVISRTTQHAPVDMSEARDVIGWEPADIWPAGSPWEQIVTDYKAKHGG